MFYHKFIDEAKKKTIQQSDNEVWYLEPEWKDIVCREIESDLSKIDDSYLDTWFDVEDILRLEVNRRNAQNDKKAAVISWLYSIITTTVEPAMLSEETDYIKQVIEFMKTNHKEQKQE